MCKKDTLFTKPNYRDQELASLKRNFPHDFKLLYWN